MLESIKQSGIKNYKDKILNENNSVSSEIYDHFQNQDSEDSLNSPKTKDHASSDESYEDHCLEPIDYQKIINSNILQMSEDDLSGLENYNIYDENDDVVNLTDG